MAQITLGGAAFINAEATAGFKEETDGKIIYEIFDVRVKDLNGVDTLVIASDVARGPNKGVHAELEEKFGKEEYPLMKYKQNSFKLNDEKALGALKTFLTNVAGEAENAAVGATITAMLATGGIDDELLKGVLYAEDTEWKLPKDGEHYRLRRKKYITVKEAMGAKPGNTKPSAVTTTTAGEGAHEGDAWG